MAKSAVCGAFGACHGCDDTAGGDPGGDSEGLFTQWAHAMKLDGVMGLMVGRSLLYPSTGTTSDAVARAVDVVHG